MPILHGDDTPIALLLFLISIPLAISNTDGIIPVMQLGSLKIFCDVARHRSFSQAAKANKITQSAVSQAISQLEKRMRVLLVDRSTRPLQLTPLGQAYFEGCKTLLEQYASLETRICRGQVEITGSVNVAAIYSVGLVDMNQFVHRFRAQFPRAEIHVDYAHPERVYEKVLDGSADLGLVSFPRKSPELTAVPWREEEMVVVCAPTHRLARLASVRWADLRGEKFIQFERNLPIRRKLDRWLRDANVTVEVEAEFDNIETIKQAVVADTGVAILPAPTLRAEVEAGRLAAIPFAGGNVVRPLGAIHRRRTPLSPAAREFLALLQSPSTACCGGNHATPPEPSADSNSHSSHANGRGKVGRSSKRTVGS